jgi:hypothetical protein
VREAPEKAMALLAPEAVMVDGVADGEALAEVVPTADLVATGVVATAGVVVLAYTGADDGATTLEVVTGLTTVHGQLVMVKVVDSVAV